MKYGNMEQNVTPLEMLPDLEDLEKNEYSSLNILPHGESEKFTRYIRGNHHNGISKQSGMNPNPNFHSVHHRLNDQKEKYDSHIQEQENNSIKTFNMPSGTPSCLDVAEHIANCPICSKFYNTNKTIYIIAIVILSLICILLLKKVLDV